VQTTRTLIADSQALFRAGLRRLLGDVRDLRVVGEARDGEEAVELAGETEADLVLMDIAMPRLSGVEAVRRIVASGSKARILIVSATETPARVQESLRAGAVGFLSKSASGRDLVAAVEAVRLGGSYLSPAMARRMADAAADPDRAVTSLERLTAREREVLAWLAEGLSSREIGHRLSVSPRTIDSHRVRLMKKLGIHKIQGLVRMAIREGLIEA
jgi:DNA-binding NarL/FixJ family response regulator